MSTAFPEAGETPRLPAALQPTQPVEQTVQTIETVLATCLSEMTVEPPPARRGRPRVLPSLALWAGLLVCVVRGFSSQLARWRLLSQGDFWWFPPLPITDQAVYRRLAREGTVPLEAVCAAVRTLLASRLDPLVPASFRGLAAFASDVVALDEMTLDQVARTLSGLRALPGGATALLGGTLAGVFDLRRQQWRTVQLRADACQNEKAAAPDLVAGLARGTLVVADLGYFGFRWFDALTDAGLWWVSRLRAKTSYTLLHVYYQDGETLDALIWLGAYRADRTRYAARLAQFRVGATLHRYLTNVREPQRFPLYEIAQVYARRWDIELAFLLLKEHLHLALLWSAKPVVTQQQVWAALIVSQVIHAFQFEIAARAACDPFEVSLALVVEYFPRLAADGHDPLQVFVQEGRRLRFIRPSTRTKIVAPLIPPDQLASLPPGLVLEREPRYAGKV
jgi:Transposase DDE domain